MSISSTPVPGIKNGNLTTLKEYHVEWTHISIKDLAQHRGKFGYLASISTCHSNKNFKAKRIRDDLLFIGAEIHSDEEVLKSTNKIIQSLKDMEVKWTEQQREAMNQKLAENLKKRAGMDNYREILLQRCKKHEGSVVTVSE